MVINMELKGISVVEFSGNSCASCISMMSLLTSILNKYEDVNLMHVELDENSLDIINKYQIDRFPTIIVFKDKQEIARARGFQVEEILSLWLDNKINVARGGK